MPTFESRQPAADLPPGAGGQPIFRSSAVARLAGMPVSTLRIWEQRYQAVAPTTAATGHRQYSAGDVERVVLLRQLTRQGHAIGSLALLGIGQLRELASAHAAAVPATRGGALPALAAPRIVVVGRALARRLERPAVASGWPTAPEVVAVFDSLADAVQGGLRGAGPVRAGATDLLVWHAPDLQADALPGLQAAQRAWNAHHAAVAYRFAGAAARDALITAGARVVREPADDAALSAWLVSLVRPAAEPPSAAAPTASREATGLPWSLEALNPGAAAAPARRFDDATLTTFAGLTSSVACECPGHVAELLMQIASFERYSATCSSRSPSDAELHAYLQRVAGAARVLFEAALERVATAEGLALP